MKTALERIRENALSKFRGRLDRLAYLAEMRDPVGQYSHWGLAKVYGEASVGQAAEDAHGAAFIDVLRAPIPELAEEPVVGAPFFQQELTLLSPANHHGGCKQHLRMLRYVLSSLVQQAASLEQGSASPLRPPDQ